ncbi:MAG TPA: hypothetical protein VFZ53_24560 [Polyangiaceae bacterium]
MTRPNRRFVAVTAGVFAVALGLIGCAAPSSLPPGVAAKPMPQGAEWQGVYQGPYHIYLRITRTGDHAQGSWRAMGGREGKLWGDLDGNVMKFTFAEHDQKSKSSWSGRGYFVYSVKKPGDVPEIRGEWGLGMSDPNASWYAVKKPDVALDDAEKKLADTDSTGPGEDNTGGTGCMGAACVGEDRELSDFGDND